MTSKNLKNNVAKYFRAATITLIETNNKLQLFIQEKLENQRMNTRSLNVFEQALKFTIVLTISAFLYWRIFFQEFKTDYFLLFFSLEDAPYILYYKSSLYAYALILLLFFAWPYLLNMTNRNIKWLIATGIIGILCYVLAEIDELTISQSLIIFFSTILMMFFYACIDRNAIYCCFVITAAILCFSAKNDARKTLDSPLPLSLISKDGQTLLDESDKDRFFVTSTSKYYIVYNRKQKKLEKFNRDEVR